jgi:peptidoglycan/xylan/chitin deacetylase (PgdA/CDA1 family)
VPIKTPIKMLMACLAATLLFCCVSASSPAHLMMEHQSAKDIKRCGMPPKWTVMTLDDWAWDIPNPDQYLIQVGKTAQDAGIKMMFFFINAPLLQYPLLAPALEQQGHNVFNHSYDHLWQYPGQTLVDLSQVTPLATARSLVKNEITMGVQTNLFRPPYGAYNSRVKRWAAQVGYYLCTFTWIADEGDLGSNQYKTPDEIVNSFRQAPLYKKKANVLVCHMDTPCAQPSTLLRIFQVIRDRGAHWCRNTGPQPQTVPFDPLQINCGKL